MPRRRLTLLLAICGRWLYGRRELRVVTAEDCRPYTVSPADLRREARLERELKAARAELAVSGRLVVQLRDRLDKHVYLANGLAGELDEALDRVKAAEGDNQKLRAELERIRRTIFYTSRSEASA